MPGYPVLIEGDDGFSEWQRPHHTDYKLACCDCGLVHRMQFRVDEGQVEYRIGRDKRATAAARVHRRKRKGL